MENRLEMRYNNVLCVCVCICTPQAVRERMTARWASMKSVGMDARDTNIGPVPDGAFSTTWDFHLYNKASLLFNTLPRQTSPTSASILDTTRPTPSLG